MNPTFPHRSLAVSLLAALALSAGCTPNEVNVGNLTTGGSIAGSTAGTIATSSGGISTSAGATTVGTGASTGAVRGMTSSSGGPGTGTGTAGASTNASNSAASSTGASGGASVSTSGSSGSNACNTLDAGEPELSLCSQTSDCNCPSQCVEDFTWGNTLCELPCSTQGDCDLNFSACECNSDQCTSGFCGLDGCNTEGASCGTAQDGSGDGLCMVFEANNVSLCLLPGTAALNAPCVEGPTGDPSALCGPGLSCLANGHTCQANCATNGDCPSGESCVEASLASFEGPTAFNGAVTVCTANGSCAADAGAEFAFCDLNSQCGCPLSCVSDPGLNNSVCELSCTTTADCPNTGTQCISGFCSVSTCAQTASSGGGSCITGDAGGNCFNFQGFATPDCGECIDTNVCFQAGTATTECDFHATRANLSEICPVGFGCDGNPATSTKGTCKPLCGEDFSCPNGDSCFGVSLQTLTEPLVEYGVCSTTPADAGSVNCVPPDAGAAGVQYSTCSFNSDCGCPLSCGYDSTQQSFYCQAPCGDTSQCQNPGTICVGGRCVANNCDDWGNSCDAGGAAGTCLPPGATPGIVTGLCTVAGTASTTCITNAARSDLSHLCPVGDACVATGFDTSTAPGSGQAGVCALICDTASCPANDFGCGSVSTLTGDDFDVCGSCGAVPGGEIQTCGTGQYCDMGCGVIGFCTDLPSACTGNASCDCLQGAGVFGACVNDAGIFVQAATGC